MKNFSYKAPRTLDEATQLLENNRGSMIIAGGMTLIPDMKAGLTVPKQLVDLAKIGGLKNIKQVGDRLLIGALTTHAEIAENPLVVENLAALAEMAGDLGDPAVRVKGTIGGALAVNDPSADYPTAILALDGIIVTNQREIPAHQFFVDAFDTALARNEIIIGVILSIPTLNAYSVFRGQALTRPLCGVFISVFSDSLHVAVTGLSRHGVFRWTELEQQLSSRGLNEAFPEIQGLEAVPLDKCLDSIHASAAYRQHLAAVLAKRAFLTLKH